MILAHQQTEIFYFTFNTNITEPPWFGFFMSYTLLNETLAPHLHRPTPNRNHLKEIHQIHPEDQPL